MGSHPTDAERAERVAGVRARVAAALRDGDADGLASLLRDDATWVAADGQHTGDDARRAARGLVGEGLTWGEAQVSGARAVWRNADGARGLVVELRGGAMVWAAQVP